MNRLIIAAVICTLALFDLDASASAEPTPMSKFIAGATQQPGLFPIWKKEGKVYFELTPAQLDHDFIETVVPGSGLGGSFVVWGNTDHLPAMLVRFHRTGNRIAILWPNTNVVAPRSPSAQAALEHNFPQSVVGVGDIAAVDDKTGNLVVDLSSLLGDVLDMNNLLKNSLGNPSAIYRLDADKTYFGETKAFPLNDVIAIEQTWATETAHVTAADIAPDARNVQMRVVYNFAQPPNDGDYRPRYADDRIGLYDAIYLNYDNDHVRQRQQRFLIRWNLQPSDPGRRISPAKHPMVFTMSNTIPPPYRAGIRDAVLAWNKAFEKIGISDALQVQDQPADPNFDADDIRYNMLRWITESRSSFGADSQTLYDPRTGQEFRTGVLISADIPLRSEQTWKYIIDPIRYGRDTDPMPADFVHNALMATILHETGHNLGMQHNFIGHEAYTAAQLQDPAFTSKNGVASTVMEYSPLNIWPRKYRNGAYETTALGPYDYFTMKYGYATIPGANSPEAELPTLRRWAEAWSDPRYRYASDEDVSWQNGHASDPRVQQDLLTNNEIAWCQTQLPMWHDLMTSLDRRVPKGGEEYEVETDVFGRALRGYSNCATMGVHYLGGQYISRAHRGDPHAAPAIVPVSRETQQRAFAMLDKYLFADSAWRYSPRTLQHLGYSEWAGYGYVSWPGYGNLPQWAYDPPDRHDFALAQRITRMQSGVIDQLFNPLVLQRIDENSMQATAPTPRPEEIFGWMQRSIFGEITPGVLSISLTRRNLQTLYAQKLLALATHPAKGTPSDAQALARAQLEELRARIVAALHGRRADTITRAHLANLRELK